MMFTMIVCNDVLDIFIHFIDNDPRADIGTPVFMTDLSTDWYMVMGDILSNDNTMLRMKGRTIIQYSYNILVGQDFSHERCIPGTREAQG